MQKDKELADCVTRGTNHDKHPAAPSECVVPSDTLVSSLVAKSPSSCTNQLGQSSIVRAKPTPNLGHIWHPDNFGTQFSNGTLTITINDLSLEKDWYALAQLPL